MTEINYESDVRIDESSLDLEWLDQPSLMMKYSKIEAVAKREVDRLKEKLEVTRAELDRDIRQSPDSFDLPKVTEGAVASAIILQKEYKEALEELRDAQYEYNMARAAVQSMDQKKTALENLGRLLGLQYFAGPQVPRDLPDEVKRRMSDNVRQAREKEGSKRSNKKIKIRRTK